MTTEDAHNRDENVSLRLAKSLQDEHGIAKAIGLLSMAHDFLEWQMSVLYMSTVKAAGWKLEIVDPEGENITGHKEEQPTPRQGDGL